MSRYAAGFSIAGSVLTIAFLIVVNLITNGSHPWFIYPSFVLLLWPISHYFMVKGEQKKFSMVCSLLIIGFLFVVNYIQTPEYPWFLYPILPILWWPILIYLGKRAKSLAVAMVGSTSIMLYYIILNIFLAPGHPWAIYPIFAVLWWPLAIYHAQKRSYVAFSVHASLLIGIFFITVNMITSPDTIWAVYPIFAVIWWPLSMYYFVHKRKSEV